MRGTVAPPDATTTVGDCLPLPVTVVSGCDCCASARWTYFPRWWPRCCRWCYRHSRTRRGTHCQHGGERTAVAVCEYCRVKSSSSSILQFRFLSRILLATTLQRSSACLTFYRFDNIKMDIPNSWICKSRAPYYCCNRATLQQEMCPLARISAGWRTYVPRF